MARKIKTEGDNPSEPFAGKDHTDQGYLSQLVRLGMVLKGEGDALVGLVTIMTLIFFFYVRPPWQAVAGFAVFAILIRILWTEYRRTRGS